MPGEAADGQLWVVIQNPRLRQRKFMSFQSLESLGLAPSGPAWLFKGELAAANCQEPVPTAVALTTFHGPSLGPFPCSGCSHRTSQLTNHEGPANSPSETAEVKNKTARRNGTKHNLLRGSPAELPNRTARADPGSRQCRSPKPRKPARHIVGAQYIFMD